MKKNFWQKLKRPIKVLAPMAGYTDSAFRLMCKKFGADVVVSELISADAIAFGKLSVIPTSPRLRGAGSNQLSVKVTGKKNNSTADLLSFYEAERPFVVQLFGKNTANFAKATKWITANLKPDGIDINMGCPARKVVGSDHGAALLKNPALAVEIVKAVRENTTLPVSVKTRLGWEKDDEILEFAPLLADAGINAIIIHGRTYKDGFSGVARWKNIYKVKEILGKNIIVIGNGDVGINDNCQMIYDKNLIDGYAIGRASFGKPWAFCEAEDKLKVESRKLKEIILEHAKLAEKSKGDKGIVEFRKHLLVYIKGFSNAKKIRLEAVKVSNVADVEKILERLD